MITRSTMHKVNLSAGCSNLTSPKTASLHLQSDTGASHDPDSAISQKRNRRDHPVSSSRTQSPSSFRKARSTCNVHFYVSTSVHRSLATLPVRKSWRAHNHFTQRQLAGRRLSFPRARSNYLDSGSTIPKAALGGDVPGGSRGGVPDGGDSDVQNVLLEVLRIQLGKTRVTQFLDEKSEHLREIAHGSDEEFERIAERAMKRVDGMGSQVLRDLDAGALAVERDLEIARIDLEAQERDFEEFQARMYSGRNDGLFFQNLYPRVTAHRGAVRYPRQVPRVVKIDVELEVLGKLDPGVEMYRFFLYGGIFAVLLSFLWSACLSVIAGANMRLPKLGAYGVIFTLLVLQVKFEKVLLGSNEGEETEQEK